MELLRNFKELDKGDVGLAGGKGASLGEMTKAGIPVPPGFVVLSASFEKFIIETGLISEIDAVLESVNHEEVHTVENASEKIQALILAADMPKDIAVEIRSSFKKLGATYVAVRSSATAEDSSSAAWAGQLESYLNTTEKDVLRRVKQCWASLFTPRAIFYRFEKGLHTQKISVAVVVQKMVESEVSGIAFSVHPVTQDRNQLIIEASYGLGEAIVSGQVTPDSYVVEKKPRRIIERMVQDKKRGMYRSSDDANEWRDIPKAKAEAQALSDAQIEELSELILHIENHYGFPCDIEWALEKKKFYIVQSRPITTLTEASSKSHEVPKDPLILLGAWNVLPLEAWRWFDIASIKRLEKLSGVNIRVFTYVEDELHYECVFEREVLELKDRFEEQGTEKKQIAYIKKIYDDFYAEVVKLERYVESRTGKDPRKLSDRELIASIQKFADLWTPITSQIWYAVFLDIWYPFPEDHVAVKKIAAAARDRTGHLHERSNAIERPLYIEAARRLKLSQKEIQYLFPAEIVGALKKHISLKKIAIERSKFCVTSSTTGKYEIYSGDEARKLFEEYRPPSVGTEAQAELSGTTACRGAVTGVVRVIRRDQDFASFKEGEVLVALQTMVHYVPIMKKASAILTEFGGLTSHAAIVSRELNKPCVVGIPNLLASLMDGDRVEVDADRGIVRKLWDDGGRSGSGQMPGAGPASQGAMGPGDAGANIVVLSKVFSREKPLFYFSLWNDSDRRGWKKFLGHDIEQNLFTIPGPGQKGSVWYASEEIAAVDALIAERLKADRTLMPRIVVVLDKNWKKLWPYLGGKKKIEDLAEFARYYEWLVEWWSAMSTVFNVPSMEGEVSSAIRKTILKHRTESEKYTERMSKLMVEFWKEKFPALADAAFYVTPAEVQKMKGPSSKKLEEELRARMGGCFMFNGTVYLMRHLDEVLEKNGLALEKSAVEGVTEIKGATAYRGKVRGRVKKIAAFADMRSFSPGEILVTEMTNPDYVPIMKIAAAVVTDEGGATCHAAIASRELKVPCVVGTKIATQVLNDGDMVEVDADRGTITIVEAGGHAEGPGSNIIDRVKKVTWMTLKGSGTPLLIGYGARQWTALAFARFPDYAVMDFCIFYAEKDGSHGIFAIDESQYIRSAKRLLDNLGDLQKIYDEFCDDEKRFHAAVSKLGQGAGLSKRYPDFIKAYDAVYSSGIFADGFLAYSESFVDGMRKKYPRRIPEIDVLIQPYGLNFLQEERLGLMKIALGKGGDLKSHQRAFHWIQNNYKDAAKLPLSYFEKELRTAKNESPKILEREMKALVNYPRDHRAAVEKIRTGKIFSRLDLEQLLWIGKIAWWVDRRKACNLIANHEIMEYAQTMAKQIKVPCGDLLFLLPEELEAAIKDPSSISHFPLKERREKVAFAYANDGERAVWTGSEAQLIKDIIEPPISEEARDIRGMVAYKGVVRGAARIIFDPRGEYAFNEGDILVTGMTRPDFVPLMKKAGAVVTDEGGITCHAAIVSRELKKPCIIGTKIATKVLKDGDMIEVDADRGEVRILDHRSAERWNSPVLAGFNPDEYEFHGLWKSPMLTEYFWAVIFDAHLAKELRIPIKEIGSFKMNEGNFFTKRSVQDELHNVLMTALDEKDWDFFDNLETVLDRQFKETYVVMKRISSVPATGEAVQKATDALRSLAFLECVGYLFTFVFDPEIGKALYAEGVDPAEVGAYLLEVKSPLLARQKELAVMQASFKKEKLLDKDPSVVLKKLRTLPKLKKMFDDHLEKYGWVEILGFGGSKLTAERLINGIQHFEDKASHLELKKKILSKGARDMLRAARSIAYVRQLGAEYFAMCSLAIRPLFESAGQKIGLDWNDLLKLNPEEIERFLRAGDRAGAKALVVRRSSGRWALFQNLEGQTCFVDDLGDIARLESKLLKKADDDVQELRGQIGYKGIVQGPVCILLNSKDFAKMKKGDVLVTTMTTPDFIATMQMASAIVTDIGGLLSHAAIVSRELRTPCVIGTQNATQILKDGDLVEVDADRGVVRKIGRGGTGDSPQAPADNGDGPRARLSKFMSREHSFFYANIWNEANRDYFQQFVPGTNIKNMLFLRDSQGVLGIYYDLDELEKACAKIGARVTKDPQALDAIIADFHMHWKKIWPYISGKKKVKNIKELQEYYKNCVSWWVPMADLFVIPDRDEVPKRLRDKALKVREETQEYSDALDRVYMDFMKAQYPEYAAVAELLAPEEIYKLETLTKSHVADVKKRSRDWALATVNGVSRFGSMTELRGILDQNGISVEGLDGDATAAIDFKKSYSRDTTLFMQILWAKGLVEEARSKFGWANPYLPYVAHFVNEGVVEIWEHERAIQWFLDKIFAENKRPAFFTELLAEYKVLLGRLKKIHQKKYLSTPADVRAYTDLVYRAAFDMTIFFYVGMDPRSSERVKKIAVQARKEGDFFADNDAFVRKSIARLGKISEAQAGVVLPNELVAIPSGKVLDQRLRSFLLIHGEEGHLGSLESFIEAHPQFRFDRPDAVQVAQISGQIAFKGIVRGKVCIVRKQGDLGKIGKGDILVSPMTTPDFLPAMQKAAAFVTDEGGVTCHAAIVSREMKKPCIIGTKIATEVLHDGDLVQVDAEKGVVTVIERKDAASEGATDGRTSHRLRPTVKRDISLFSVEAWQAGYTKYLKESLDFWYNVVFYYDGEKVNFYHTEDDFSYFKNTITGRLIADDALFARLNKDFQKNVKQLGACIARVDAKNLARIFELSGRIMSFYIFVVSDRFVEARPEAWKSRIMSEGILYDADEQIGAFLRKKLSAAGKDTSLAHFLRYAEIRQLLDGKELSFGPIEERKRGYIILNDEFLTNVGFPEYCKAKGWLDPEEEIQKEDGPLQGVCAEKGRVRGRVVIVKSRQDFQKVQQGDVVVSIMTNANYLPVLVKSAAFVTDEGGVTCHAAIAARELKKPCVIGTKIATRVLKDGDMVEVDATKGTVKKIK